MGTVPTLFLEGYSRITLYMDIKINSVQVYI